VLLSLPIVAASIPVGAGAALAFQQMGKPNVAIIYLGDASLEEGVYHETANFAALKNLPVIFICENNLYSVYTNLQDRQPNRPLTDLGRAHGLESHKVDGNNVKDVFHLASAAVEKARRGEGPSFILADTYRWREHCGPNYDNDLGYRTTEEFEAWRKTDPISCLRRDLFSKKFLDETAEAKITQEISEEIDSAFQLAEAAPYPDAHLVGSRIYA
jgi:pyruvate dehydrogenase E1 component alpha subunit